MDLLDIAPSLPSYDQQDSDAILGGRRPSLGEYLGAAVGQGWWGTSLGAFVPLARESVEARQDPRPLSREEWQASPHFRPGLSYDERMTEGRAAAMARVYDENRYRQAVLAARDPGWLESVLGFGAQIIGSIPDPINFLPVAGPLSKGLRAGEAALEAGIVARGLARSAAALEARGIAASALRGTADAVVGNILAAPFVYSVQSHYGDEITFGTVATDLAIGALIGAGFGAVGGAVGGAVDRMMKVRAIQPDPMAAARVLDAAARDVASGRPIEVPTELAARAVNDAILRSAPPEVEPLIRAEGTEPGPLPDLPTRPDGTPLTREEFEARLLEAAESAQPQPQPQPPALHSAPEQPPLARREVAPDAARVPEEGAAKAIEAPSPVAAPNVRPMEPGLARGAMDEAYRWYTEALAAQQHIRRLAAATPRPVPEAEAQPQVGSGGKPDKDKAEADPEAAQAAAELRAMRADGRLTAEDEAILRSGEGAAQEIEALAKGMEQAAVCMAMRVA